MDKIKATILVKMVANHQHIQVLINSVTSERPGGIGGWWNHIPFRTHLNDIRGVATTGTLRVIRVDCPALVTQWYEFKSSISRHSKCNILMMMVMIIMIIWKTQNYYNWSLLKVNLPWKLLLIVQHMPIHWEYQCGWWSEKYQNWVNILSNFNLPFPENFIN